MSKRLIMLLLRRAKPFGLVLFQCLELVAFVIFALKGVGNRIRRYKYMMEKVEK
jgi:hypothetical protein